MPAERVHVLFLAAALDGFNVPHGGHYYSCATLARALSSEEVRTSALSIGHFAPGGLHHSLPDALHVGFTGLPTPATWRALEGHVRRLRPTHLHAFDLPGALVARLLALRFRLPVVITKPGGVNEYTPRARDVVAFSGENFEDLARRYKGHDVRLHLIPNRILPVEPDPERIAALRARLGHDRPIILRIARFAPEYLTSIRQTAALARDLSASGQPCHAVIVGGAQAPPVAAEVRALAGPDVTVLEEPQFTRNAAALLPVADLVVGTGRGFMEAAVQGRILMTTMAGLRYPLLVDESNFEGLFKTNFSPRNQAPGASDAATFEAVRALLADPAAGERAHAFARTIGRRFDVREALPTYRALYEGEHRPAPLDLPDLAEHGARVTKLLLRLRLRQWRRARAGRAAVPASG